MSRVFALAALAAVGMAIIPEVLPTGGAGTDKASGLLAAGQTFIASLFIFLGGLGTALTPCVYPLIPITVGVFGARQADSRLRAAVLTSAYVFGMGIVFAGLGVFAAASGKAFGTMLGSPWIAGGLAIFMFVLASSMFGAFELALPTGLATKLNGVGGAGLLGALLMGSVAGFLAAPCTGPVLSGLLAWIATTQDMTLGGSLLFIYAMGIGVPFFLIGVFTVRLPKGGEWMEWVKSVFGVMLVALGVGYVRDAWAGLRGPLSDAAAAMQGPTLLVVTSGLAFVGVMLGAIHLSFKEGPGKASLKAAGVLALVAGFLLRIAPPPEAHDWTMVDIAKAESLAPFETALANAKASGRPVVIDFFAEWCAACKELDKFTYVAPEVKGELGRFAMVKVDGTNDHSLLNKLYDKFGVQGLPTVVFISSSGDALQDPKITGFLEPEKFVAELKKVR